MKYAFNNKILKPRSHDVTRSGQRVSIFGYNCLINSYLITFFNINNHATGSTCAMSAAALSCLYEHLQTSSKENNQLQALTTAKRDGSSNVAYTCDTRTFHQDVVLWDHVSDPQRRYAFTFAEALDIYDVLSEAVVEIPVAKPPVKLSESEVEYLDNLLYTFNTVRENGMLPSILLAQPGPDFFNTFLKDIITKHKETK